ncbi:MAG: hypothetical protein HKN68_12500 [Saprospiraceae bacterium]|nr:hypothetical protein [Saprospiraceae bacterium]
MDRQLSSAIIDGYHLLIKDRYQYDRIKSKYDIPDSVTEDKFQLLRNYFINQIYPTAERRAVLDRAFASLDNHLKRPDHLIKMLIDSGRILLKMGWHFPKTMQVGLKALKSFRVASRMEEKLIVEAIELEMKPPLDPNDIKTLIGRLPRKELDRFIDDGMVLFETLYDRSLIMKILDIIGQVINMMKRKSGFYSEDEIAGMALGFEVLEQGNALFEALSIEEQEVIFNLIREIETDALNELN